MLLDWIARMKATADAKAAQRGPEEADSKLSVTMTYATYSCGSFEFKFLQVARNAAGLDC